MLQENQRQKGPDSRELQGLCSINYDRGSGRPKVGMAPVKEIRAVWRMQKTVNEEHVIECKEFGDFTWEGRC